MCEKSEGEMGMEHKEHHTGHDIGLGTWSEIRILWDKLDDQAKKTIGLRMLDQRIMHEDHWIAQHQHKVETMEMVKTWIEKL